MKLINFICEIEKSWINSRKNEKYENKQHVYVAPLACSLGRYAARMCDATEMANQANDLVWHSTKMST